MIGYSSVLARWSMNIISLGFCQIHGISQWINRSFSGILCLIGPIGPAKTKRPTKPSTPKGGGHVSGHSVHYLVGQKIGVRSYNWQVHCLFLPVIFNTVQLKHPCGDWISEVSVTFLNHKSSPFCGTLAIITCWELFHGFWLFETYSWIFHIEYHIFVQAVFAANLREYVQWWTFCAEFCRYTLGKLTWTPNKKTYWDVHGISHIN